MQIGNRLTSWTFVLGMAAVLGLSAGLAPQPSAAASPASDSAGAVATVEDLGPASEVTYTGVAEQVGDHIWTATSGVSPVVVGAYDVTTHLIDRKVSLPSGAGAWAMTHIGTDLYIGLYSPGDLYRIDTITGTLTKVANFGSFIWAITATPDGTIVAGTYPDAGVFEYDPATGVTRSYGTVVAGEMYVRSIAADQDTIYAGVGTKAHLVAIDRATGAKTELLPAKYADRTFVATLALSGDRLVAGLSPTGTMLVFDTADLSNPVEVQAPLGDQYVTAITIDPATGDIYFGTRLSGTLYRYTASGVLERLGSPYDGASFNRIFVNGSSIRAELSSQVVEYDVATAQFAGYDLVTAGLPPTPEQPMQIAATKGTVLVSGKAGIQIHDLSTGASTRTFLSGEAKTMTPVDGTVYLGVYTLARLFSMKPDGTALTELVSIEHEQTRPTDATYDKASNELLVTTEADYGRFNGALVEYHLGTKLLEVHRGVVPDQSVQSVGVDQGVAFLGSNIRNSFGTEPIVKSATISAFDLATNTVSWQVTPVEGAAAIMDVLPFRGRIYATTNTGKLVELDPATGAVLTTVAIATSASQLVQARGALYGTDGKRVFQVLPAPHAAPTVRTVVDGLAAANYSYAILTASYNGDALYTIKNRNLIRVSNLPGNK